LDRLEIRHRRHEKQWDTNFQFCFRIIRAPANPKIPGQVLVKESLASTGGKELSKCKIIIRLFKDTLDRVKILLPKDITTEHYKEAAKKEPLRPITFQDLS
jgi:hypothetical protein